MSFHFKRGESIPAGIQRILLAQLDIALNFLSTPEHPLDHRVHEARKCLKRLRALFALVDGNVDAELVERERRHVRHAAHALAELRGQAALNETFLSLMKRYPDALPLIAIGEVERLLDSGTSASTEAVAQALGTAIEALTRARDGARHFDVEGKGFAAVERGFQRTYARARRDFRRAKKTRSVEHLHDFRTHEKRHLYQLELFAKLWPKLLAVECKDLDRLGEHLGEHHDLSLLLPALQRCTTVPVGGIEQLIDRRRRDLERKILARAARLFSETPKSRARRFRGYHAAFGLRAKKDDA